MVNKPLSLTCAFSSQIWSAGPEVHLLI
jgi:hypothetical protein